MTNDKNDKFDDLMTILESLLKKYLKPTLKEPQIGDVYQDGRGNYHLITNICLKDTFPLKSNTFYEWSLEGQYYSVHKGELDLVKFIGHIELGDE